jgi:hypothetical protein
MKKLFVPAFLFTSTVSLWAADFWQAKPFTEWSEKDIQKMMESSPWSKPFSVALAANTPENTRGGRRAGSTTGGSSGGVSQMNGPAGTTEQGGLGRYAGSAGDPGGAVPTLNLVVRWQSAMPVREAVVKAKFGSEAATSPEAKKALEEPVNHYILAIRGVPQGALQGDSEEVKKQMLSQGMLLIRGKDPIKPVDFLMQGSGRATEVLFAFPKTTPITEEDKEVEFVVHIGDYNIKQKFRLKDMLVNGKLDL